MKKLGASKSSLTTFCSEDKWQRTGRLQSSRAQLFKIDGGQGEKYLLSPTHEEEITSLVGGLVKSEKDLPLRLFQISRKYRNEKRPRQSLLRTKEFLMKDLYTFDASAEGARKTYEIVRQSYNDFFDELKIPYLIARASSGDIGGDISHEYHIPTSKGEDRIIICGNCTYVANEELAEGTTKHTLHNPKSGHGESQDEERQVHGEQQTELVAKEWFGISKDRSVILQAFLPTEIDVNTTDGVRSRKSEINHHAVRKICPQIDLSLEDPLAALNEHLQASMAASTTSIPMKIMRIFDVRHTLTRKPGKLQYPPHNIDDYKQKLFGDAYHECLSITWEDLPQMDLVRVEGGDPCPRCPSGTLKVEKAVELGHTFYLGTRYSEPLNATFVASAKHATSSVQNPTGSAQLPIQMGCHGIGVSRLVAAVANALADSKGLNWPRVIAPFEIVVVPTKGQEEGAREVYDILSPQNPSLDELEVLDTLMTGQEVEITEIMKDTYNRLKGQRCPLDTIIDDREKNFGWKMADADLIGFPIIVVVGRDWQAMRECEVQCRRLEVKRNIAVGSLRVEIKKMLELL